MSDLQLESDVGSYCNKLLELLSYSRRFTRVKRKLPGATVRRARQLYTLQYFAQKPLNLSQRP